MSCCGPVVENKDLSVYLKKKKEFLHHSPFYLYVFFSIFPVSAIVEHDYTAMQPDELNLVKGAIIQNIKVQPGGWWEGTIAASGKTGMFPDNFVRVLEPDDKNPVVLR